MKICRGCSKLTFYFPTWQRTLNWAICYFSRPFWQICFVKNSRPFYCVQQIYKMQYRIFHFILILYFSCRIWHVTFFLCKIPCIDNLSFLLFIAKKKFLIKSWIGLILTKYKEIKTSRKENFYSNFDIFITPHTNMLMKVHTMKEEQIMKKEVASNAEVI